VVRIFLGVLLFTMLAGLAQCWVLWRHNLPPHWLAFGYDDLIYFRQSVWAYTLLNLTSAALIFCALQDNVIARLLSFRPLIYVGAISFGVYVWHLPLMRIFAAHWPAQEHSAAGLLRFAVYFVTTLAVASISYYSFERYFLRMKKFTFGAIWKRGLRVPPASATGDAPR
jgi:peptidoglycan/LPS O-acetylase OafA/YrhL